MTRRLRVPPYKKLIIQGKQPKEVLETVFKKFKGTRHDTSIWKRTIKSHITQFVKSRKQSKKNRVKKTVK